MFLKLCAIFLLQITCGPKFLLAQGAPYISCPEIFQYSRNGDANFGKITLRDVPFGNLKVEVKFVQREPISTQYVGSLQFEYDILTVQRYMENNWPITYRVHFPNPRILPKLTSIIVNDVQICSGNSISPPSTSYSLRRSFYPAPGSKRRQDAASPPIRTQTVYTVPPQQPIYTTPVQRPIIIYTTQRTDFSNNPFINRFHQSQSTIPSARPQLPSAAPVPSPVPAPPSTATPTLTVINAATPTTSQDVSALCGLESNGALPLINQGTIVMRGQLPWLTVIYVKQPGVLNFICGGSLISVSTVLTAAHCFKLHNWSKDQIVVYLGRNNLDRFGESGTEARDVETLLVHPDFNTNLFSDADIALLHLESPISFTRYIRPICLWSEVDDTNIIVGQIGYVAGWGSDETGRNVTARPKVVDARIVSESECLRSSQIFNEITSRRTLCAGNRDGTGPCSGDSGGGFMMNRNGRWTLRGVVSTGQLSAGRQCDLRQYVVYCDVAKHITWVRNNMWS